MYADEDEGNDDILTINGCSIYSTTQCLWEGHGLDPQVLHVLCSSPSDASRLGIILEVGTDVTLGTVCRITVRDELARDFTVTVTKRNGDEHFLLPDQAAQPLYVADGEKFAVLRDATTVLDGAAELHDRFSFTGARSVGGVTFQKDPHHCSGSKRGTENSLTVAAYWLRFADAHGDRATFRFGSKLTECLVDGCRNRLQSGSDGEVVSTSSAQVGVVNGNLAHICVPCAKNVFHHSAANTIEGRDDIRPLGSRQSAFTFRNQYQQLGFGGVCDLAAHQLTPRHLPRASSTAIRRILDGAVSSITSSRRRTLLWHHPSSSVNLRPPLPSSVFFCLPLSTFVLLCPPLSSSFLLCLALSASVFLCLVLSSSVFLCHPLSTSVLLCLKSVLRLADEPGYYDFAAVQQPAPRRERAARCAPRDAVSPLWGNRVPVLVRAVPLRRGA